VVWGWLFLLIVALTSAACAEGDESSLQEEVIPIKVGEGTAEGDADLPAVASKPQSPPISKPPARGVQNDQSLESKVDELSKELVRVKSELARVKGGAPHHISPASPSSKSQPQEAKDNPHSKDAIGDLIGTGAEDDSGSKNPAEQAAMASAREHAGHGTLEVDSVHGQYNKLCGLYNETMMAEGDAFKAKAKEFKIACAQFIQEHNDHSFSRSAIFYLGSVLLKNGELKEAQQAFATAYKGDEKGPHAADALLGMAEVQAKSNQKDLAKGLLTKVKKDFDSHYLSEDTKEKFKQVSKLAGVQLTLGKGQPSEQGKEKSKAPVLIKDASKKDQPKNKVQSVSESKQPAKPKNQKSTQA